MTSQWQITSSTVVGRDSHSTSERPICSANASPKDRLDLVSSRPALSTKPNTRMIQVPVVLPAIENLTDQADRKGLKGFTATSRQ